MAGTVVYEAAVYNEQTTVLLDELQLWQSSPRTEACIDSFEAILTLCIHYDCSEEELCATFSQTLLAMCLDIVTSWYVLLCCHLSFHPDAKWLSLI